VVGLDAVPGRVPAREADLQRRRRHARRAAEPDRGPVRAGDTNTYWKTHGETATSKRRIRLAVYRTLLLGSRGFSMLAHRCNPNLGSRVRPERPDQ
jgi:hypothetical protein